MKPSYCLFNSAAALQRVFIGTASISETSAQLQRVVFIPTFRATLRTLNPPTRRHISATATRHDQGYRPLFKSPKAPPASKIQFGRGYQLKDEEIRYQMVCLKRSAAEGGGITEPQLTQRILKRINRETHSLILRVEPNPEEDRYYPICEVVDKKAEYKAMVEKKKKQKEAKASKVSKELEINWATAPNDLNTKLKQLRSFLNKGFKVELRLVTQQKRSKKKASLAEMKAVMQTVEDAIAGIQNTKEYKPREGDVGKSATVMMYLRGVKTKGAKESNAKESDAEESGAEESDAEELDAEEPDAEESDSEAVVSRREGETA